MQLRQFRTVWDQLRAKKGQFDTFLDDVRVQNLRGIRDLKVSFPYPVSVLAGPNACGKSTLLFSCASLYDAPEELKNSPKRYPSVLFPRFIPTQSDLPSDQAGETSFEFSYIERGSRKRMKWSRGAAGKWNKSFFGAKGGAQPQRLVYIRTLASLSNPTELRSLLTMGKQKITSTAVPAALLSFAHRILPRQYANLSLLSSERRDLLFAELVDGPRYSEFHMSSGERAILRLSREVSGLSNALILIDEIDVGLHPFTQQHVMLELQKMALRQNLQIVVTSHSQVVLESVPPEGRIFLERVGENVVVRESLRDVLQRAMYGRALDQLNVLCEDRIAKSIVQGVMDVLGPKLGLSAGGLDIGHDTGKDEYKAHVRSLALFKQLENFLFVLDGDGRNLESDLRQVVAGQSLKLLFLPGDESPEEWIWQRLQERKNEYPSVLGCDLEVFSKELDTLGRSFLGATDKKATIAKERLSLFGERIGRTAEEITRFVARHEADSTSGRLVDFRDQLEDIVREWRSQSGNDYPSPTA
jgi:predicted ATPase